MTLERIHKRIMEQYWISAGGQLAQDLLDAAFVIARIMHQEDEADFRARYWPVRIWQII